MLFKYKQQVYFLLSGLLRVTIVGVDRLSAWPIIGADIKLFTDYRYRPFSKHICRYFLLLLLLFFFFFFIMQTNILFTGDIIYWWLNNTGEIIYFLNALFGSMQLNTLWEWGDLSISESNLRPPLIWYVESHESDQSTRKTEGSLTPKAHANWSCLSDHASVVSQR